MLVALKRALVGTSAVVASLLLSSQAMAFQQANSGLVPNNGTHAEYLTQRCATYDGAPFQLVNSWPSAAVHMFIRDPSTNNPLGPTRDFPQNDTGWRDMGDLGTNQCFMITAWKDWTGFSGSEWWTGAIDY